MEICRVTGLGFYGFAGLGVGRRVFGLGVKDLSPNATADFSFVAWQHVVASSIPCLKLSKRSSLRPIVATTILSLLHFL